MKFFGLRYTRFVKRNLYLTLNLHGDIPIRLTMSGKQNANHELEKIPSYDGSVSLRRNGDEVDRDIEKLFNGFDVVAAVCW